MTYTMIGHTGALPKFMLNKNNCSMIYHARWYGWNKCIRSIHADKNIVQGVGFLHAKHFPDYKRFLGISEEETSVDVNQAKLFCGIMRINNMFKSFKGAQLHTEG